MGRRLLQLGYPLRPLERRQEALAVNRAPSRLIGDDDELPLGAVLFHDAMRLDDLVKPQHPLELHAAVPAISMERLTGRCAE